MLLVMLKTIHDHQKASETIGKLRSWKHGVLTWQSPNSNENTFG